MSTQTLERLETSPLLTDSEWTRREPRASLPTQRIGLEAISLGSEPVKVPFAGGNLFFPEPPPDWFWPIVEQICTLDELEEDWDSYGARTIDPHCAAAAISLLLSVLEPNTPTPAIVPTNRGGLQIEWHRGGIDLEIEVQSPSRFGVAFEDETTGEEREEASTDDVQTLVPLLERLTTTE